MKVLIINPIMYSCENKRKVPKVPSIKDTLLYDLCLAFSQEGYEVTLYTNNIYKPYNEEKYPFNIIWDEPIFTSLFLPACFPNLKNLRRFLQKNRDYYDFVISSEVFQWASLIAALVVPKKLMIWHETARHNYILKTVPSRTWYNIIAKICFKNVLIVPRSKEAEEFIKKYCNNVLNVPIEHGINSDKFVPAEEKRDFFIVCAQLIKRKRIDDVIKKFDDFVLSDKNWSHYKLYICGEGEEKEALVSAANETKSCANIEFLGKLSHHDMLPLLSHAKGLLVNSEKENSMVSIIEAIAVGTPIITTEAPLNASYIRSEVLGIVSDHWNYSDLAELVEKNDRYVQNCLKFRKTILNSGKVKQFVEVYQSKLTNG